MNQRAHTFQGAPHAHDTSSNSSDAILKSQSGKVADQASADLSSSVYPVPHSNYGHQSQRRPVYSSNREDSSYYASRPSPQKSAITSDRYQPAEPQDLMATAQMQQRPYQPIYHTPQSNSPASIASPQGHDQHGRNMYGQPPPPLSAPMYSYTQYSPMSQVHGSPYGHPGQPQHPQLTSQPMLMHPTGPPQMSHPSVANHSGGMTNSPRMKLESSQQQPPQPSARLPMSQPPPTPSLPSGPAKLEYNGREQQQQASSHGSVNASSAPGPIPATTPLVVRQDNNGVQWIAFEYSRDRVKLEYTIRCDVESVNVDELSPEFKADNCVYPRACCPKDQYRGNRLNYETECNAVGWALAELNQCLRGKRGLIQRAVDSWRNSNQDVRLRSRRVRRQAKMNSRKGPGPPGHPSSMGGLNLPGSTAMSGPNGAMGAPNSRGPPGLVSLGAPQYSHHHGHGDGTDGKSDDVSGNTDYPGATQAQRPLPQYQPPPQDLRHSQLFHGYPAYPSAPTGEPSMTPHMHHSMDSLGRPVGTAAVASAEKSAEEHHDDVFGDLPNGKRRKFILMDDAGKRVRVRVALDLVNAKEIPDTYRKKYSVFPRTFNSTDGATLPDPPRYRRYFDDSEAAENGESIISRTLVPVPMPDGAEGQLAVPQISRNKHHKEEILNELGYRLCWSQSRTFDDRHIFLQRSLDAYRNKTRSSIVSANQNRSDSVSPQFETRPGRYRWEAIEKKTKERDLSPPAAPNL